MTLSLKKLIGFINHMDQEALHSLSSRWDDLTSTEKIFCTYSQIAEKGFEEAEAILESRKSDLATLKFYKIFRAFLLIDTKNHDPNILFEALSSDLGQIDTPLLKALAYALIGYILLGERNFRLAQPFYSHSSQLFEELGCSSLAWQYKNNSLICKIRQEKKGNELAELKENFFHLETEAQVFLVRILAWQLGFSGEESEAVEILQDCLAKETLQPRKLNLKLYLAYFGEITKSKLIKRSDLRDYFEFVEMQSASMLSEKECLAMLLRWEESLVFEQKYMLTYLFFNKLLQEKRYLKLIAIFRAFEKKYLTKWEPVIAPESVYVPAYYAAIATGRKKLAHQYLECIKKDSQNWKLKKISEKVIKYSRSSQAMLISIDVAKSRIEFNGITSSWSNRRLGFQFFLSLSTSLGDFVLWKDLYESVYGKNWNPNYKEKITSLATRSLDHSQSHDCFLVNKKGIQLNPGFRILKTGMVKQKVDLRKKMLLRSIPRSPRSCGARDLAAILGVSQKTISNDINDLILENKVRKIGSRRSTRYQKI